MKIATENAPFGGVFSGARKRAENLMGDFRVTVTAVGGHGCERVVRDGGTVYGCRQMDCPDCITARYVADMRRAGHIVNDAQIQHWPGEPSEVVDHFDVESSTATLLMPRKRVGSFPGS